MNAYVELTCPHCRRPNLRVRAEHAGRVIRCRKCDHGFRWTFGRESPSAPVVTWRLGPGAEGRGERDALLERLGALEKACAEKSRRRVKNRSKSFGKGGDASAEREWLYGRIEEMETTLGRMEEARLAEAGRAEARELLLTRVEVLVRQVELLKVDVARGEEAVFRYERDADRMRVELKMEREGRSRAEAERDALKVEADWLRVRTTAMDQDFGASSTTREESWWQATTEHEKATTVDGPNSREGAGNRIGTSPFLSARSRAGVKPRG